MRWPRVPKWMLVPAALIVAPILLLVVAEVREFVDRRIARFAHFNTLDSATEEKIMLAAAIPQTFNSREEMDGAILDIKVPGYGANGNSFRQPDGSVIYLWCIEIPGRGKDRGVVFRKAGGKLVKLDDFVYDSDRDVITNVRIDGERPSYFDPSGRSVPVIRSNSRPAEFAVGVHDDMEK
jgi:hypothetical protein